MERLARLDRIWHAVGVAGEGSALEPAQADESAVVLAAEEAREGDKAHPGGVGHTGTENITGKPTAWMRTQRLTWASWARL